MNERVKAVLRPAFHHLLDLLTVRRGLPTVINGESYRLAPSCWRMFPKDYEATVQRSIRSHVRTGMSVLDVGAHVGIHTLLLARCVGTSGRVVAIEPVARAAALTRRHALLNGFGDRVQVLERVVGREAGMASFWVAADGVDPGNGLLANPEKRGRRVTIQRTTLDTICRELDLRPGFIKIDIEGGEVDALNGAIHTLSVPDPPLVVCAIHPWHLRQLGQSEESIFHLASDLGLQVLEPDGVPSKPSGIGREVVIRR